MKHVQLLFYSLVYNSVHPYKHYNYIVLIVSFHAGRPLNHPDKINIHSSSKPCNMHFGCLYNVESSKSGHKIILILHDYLSNTCSNFEGSVVTLFSLIFSTYSLEQDYSHTNQTRTYCRLPQQKSSSYPDSTL